MMQGLGDAIRVLMWAAAIGTALGVVGIGCLIYTLAF